MDEEQRYMRYVIPGFVAPVAFLISVWIAHPGAVLRIAGYVLSSPTAGLLSALVALLASGSLGFLLAQIYFACPFSVPDYRPFFQSNPAPRVPNECSELLGRIREGGICPLQRLRARRNAQVLARYTWASQRCSKREETQQPHQRPSIAQGIDRCRRFGIAARPLPVALGDLCDT